MSEKADQSRLAVTLTVAELDERITAAVKIALAEKPKHLLYDYDQAAEILNIPVSWLSERVRKEKIPHRKLGHYVRFAPADLEKIVTMLHPEALDKNKQAGVPLAQHTTGTEAKHARSRAKKAASKVKAVSSRPSSPIESDAHDGRPLGTR